MAAVSFVPRARPPIETYAVVCLLIAAGIKVSRVGPLVCPACFVLLAPSIREAFGQVGRMTAPAGGPSRVLFVPAAFAIVAAVSPVQRVLHCIPIDDDWAPDVEAAASLAGTTGRLWTTFNWGEYAIWHFGPALRVSIDGRRETVYSDDVLEWHRAVERAEPAALERMTAAAPDYVWLPAKHSATRDYLEQHGYRVTVATDQSYVAMRAGSEGVVPVARPAFSACFP
jgi:hypothetical protein